MNLLPTSLTFNSLSFLFQIRTLCPVLLQSYLWSTDFVWYWLHYLPGEDLPNTSSTEVWAFSTLSGYAHKHTVFAITCSQNEFGYRKSLIHIYWQVWLTGTKSRKSVKVAQWVVQRKADNMWQVQKKKYQERTVYLHYTGFNSMSKV